MTIVSCSIVYVCVRARARACVRACVHAFIFSFLWTKSLKYHRYTVLFPNSFKKRNVWKILVHTHIFRGVGRGGGEVSCFSSIRTVAYWRSGACYRYPFHAQPALSTPVAQEGKGLRDVFLSPGPCETTSRFVPGKGIYLLLWSLNQTQLLGGGGGGE